MNPRLRLERVAKRPTRNVEKSKPIDLDADDGLHLKDEPARVLAERKRHLEQFNNGRDGDSLLDIFNVQQAEFVRLGEDGTYVAVDWPGQATHRLRATSWNTEPHETHLPLTWALSVCAVPMKPQVRKTNLKVTRVLPKSAPAYRPGASLASKRTVLKYLVKGTGAKVAIPTIMKLSNVECDLLYRTIINASKLLAFRLALS